MEKTCDKCNTVEFWNKWELCETCDIEEDKNYTNIKYIFVLIPLYALYKIFF